MSSERPRSSGHLPSLDGLRAISICLVLIGHLDGTRNLGRLPGIHIFGDLAHLGVVVFFVISGFLITTLLIKEHEKTGTISIKLFYIRRALRIFPVAYVYIGLFGLLAAFGVVVLSRQDFICAATYTANYFPSRSWYIGHLWSLSVEEQFYLLWPAAFLFLGPRRAVWGVGAGAASGVGFRALSWLFLHHTSYFTLPTFPVVGDSLAAGCLLAISRDWLESQKWYLALFRPPIALAMLVSVLLTNRYMDYTVVWVAGTTLINVFLAVLIHRSVVFCDDLFGKLLNWAPAALVGVLSYSLYLWQQPFLNRDSTAWLAAFPQNIALVVIVAATSYFALEKPLMGLRSRLRARAGVGQPFAEYRKEKPATFRGRFQVEASESTNGGTCGERLQPAQLVQCPAASETTVQAWLRR